MEDYRDLIVWQKSMDLVKEIYLQTGKLPNCEMFGLTNQMRRAAVSIPSNIAEGYGRHSANEYVRFLNIARGSKNELETQLQICVMLGYLQHEDALAASALCKEVSRMINALLKTITNK